MTEPKQPNQSRKYHIIILLSASLILVLGALYRRNIKQQGAETVIPGIESLSSEVQQIRSLLRKSELESIQETVATLAQKSLPAIVSIRPQPGSLPPRAVNTFEDYPKPPDQPAAESNPAAVSGFLLDKQGYILTTANVGDGKLFEVRLNDQSTMPAELVARDGGERLALLKLQQPGEGLRTLELAPARESQVGEWLVRLGRSPSGQKVVSLGLLSLIRRDPAGRETFLLATRMAPEQDGGPVINLAGKVVGVSVYPPSGGPDPGITIPIEQALAAAQKLKTAAAPPQRSWVGLELQDLDGSLKEYFAVGKGVLVTGAPAAGSAFKAGLRAGDIITRLDNAELEAARELIEKIQRAPAGTRLSFTVNRRGREETVEVGTLPYPAETAPSPEAGPAITSLDEFGLELARASARQGVEIVQVRRDSPASQSGLRAGDIILEVNGEPVRGYADFAGKQENLAAARVQLWQVGRGAGRFFIAVKNKVGAS